MISLIGLGNILLKDEGVGVHVIQAIRQKYTFSPEINIVDGGTLGLDLLPIFEDSRKILIVDAVDFGKERGHVRVLEREGLHGFFQSKLSVHHIGLSDLLFGARLKGIEPEEICLIGIQPASVEAGLEMTEEISSRKEELIDLSIGRLQKWGVTCVLQSP
jgi:hydrogenase maturation protease